MAVATRGRIPVGAFTLCASGLVGYDACFTRRRSRVRFSSGVHCCWFFVLAWDFFCVIFLFLPPARPTPDTLPEWLRGPPAKRMCLARRGSNPLGVGLQRGIGAIGSARR